MSQGMSGYEGIRAFSSGKFDRYDTQKKRMKREGIERISSKMRKGVKARNKVKGPQIYVRSIFVTCSDKLTR